MKLAPIVALFVSTSLWAQVVELEKKVYCGPVLTMLKYLSSEDYREKIVWGGKSEGNDNSKYALMINSSTKTWTFLQLDEKIACILGNGTDAAAFDFKATDKNNNQKN